MCWIYASQNTTRHAGHRVYESKHNRKHPAVIDSRLEIKKKLDKTLYYSFAQDYHPTILRFRILHPVMCNNFIFSQNYISIVTYPILCISYPYKSYKACGHVRIA